MCAHASKISKVKKLAELYNVKLSDESQPESFDVEI